VRTRRRAEAAALVADDGADFSRDAGPPPLAARFTVPRTVPAAVKLVTLEAGLYVMKIGALGGPAGEIGGLALPAVQLAAPPGEDGGTVEILAGSAAGGWLGQAGGTVVVKVPSHGGRVLVTTFLPPGAGELPLAIEIERLDRHVEPAPAADPGPIPGSRPMAVQTPALRPVPSPAQSSAGDIAAEIMVHVEGVGDRRFAGGGWIGEPGARRRIEAFSIRPVERIAAGDVEFKAFGPSGRETAWVTEGKLCGTRGRGLPLTGFAVRPAPALSGRFDVVYQGSFFAAGASQTCRNGEPCLSPVADDPLEAMNIRLVERRSPRA
jgi:hypothetical protein